MSCSNLVCILFNNTHPVRMVQKEKTTWFILKDVCQAVGIKNHKTVNRRLDPSDIALLPVPHPQNPEKEICINCINEAGLYTVIMRSNKPDAKQFRRWITGTVLPSIRQTGTYSLSCTDTDNLLYRLQNTQIDQPPQTTPDLPAICNNTKTFLIQTIKDMLSSNHHINISYQTLRTASVTAFDTDILPACPKKVLLAIAPDLLQENIRLEKIGETIRENAKTNPKKGFSAVRISS